MTIRGSIIQCAECGDTWRWEEAPDEDALVYIFQQHRCDPSWLRRHRRGANLALHHAALAAYLIMTVAIHTRDPRLAGIFYLPALVFFFTFPDAWRYTWELGRHWGRHGDKRPDR